MKIKKPKRIMSLFLAALMCVTSLVGIGTTAYAAEETDDVYLISYPRDGDSNYNAEWGHGSLTFMNGWKTGTSRYTTVRAMGSYNGNICYCIESGVPQQTGDSFTKKGEDFWDNYPSSYNSTISPDDIKLFIGRIFQYGYTGTISTSWRSQNEGGDKLAHAVATQLLIWETVIGERDENFNKVSTGGKDAVLDQISPTLRELGDSSAQWDKAADVLASTDVIDRQEVKDLVPFNHLRNSRADNGMNYWTNSGFEVDAENGVSGTASFKAEGVLGMTKSLTQTVYPASRRSYTFSAQIASEDLQKGPSGQVGIEVTFEYEDGSTETRFIDLF